MGLGLTGVPRDNPWQHNLLTFHYLILSIYRASPAAPSDGPTTSREPAHMSRE